jgi:ferredoxin
MRVTVAGELIASARRAVGSCPEQAIAVTGDIEMALG